MQKNKFREILFFVLILSMNTICQIEFTFAHHLHFQTRFGTAQIKMTDFRKKCTTIFLPHHVF